MLKSLEKKMLCFVMLAVVVFSFAGCTTERPPVDPPTPTETAEFSPKKFAEDFYKALFVTMDFDTVYNCTRPPKLMEEIRERAMSEFDEPDPDFDLYAYEKAEYDDLAPHIAKRKPWYKVLAAEEIGAASTGEVSRILYGERPEDSDDYHGIGTREDYDRIADPGTDVYAVVAQWGYGEGDDAYEETELFWLCCIDGKWYIIGTYW